MIGDIVRGDLVREPGVFGAGFKRRKLAGRKRFLHGRQIARRAGSVKRNMRFARAPAEGGRDIGKTGFGV
jgi:hypothetical protein